MNEFISPPPSQKRRRTKPLRLAGTFAGVLTLLIIALAQTIPDAIRQVIPDSVEQTAANVTQTIQTAQPGLAHVTRVVDGDTIEVEFGGRKETVRFLGIDTPETHDPRKPVQCFGEAAAAYNKQLLSGKNVRLEPDPTNSDRDKYRRLLRYVYLPDGTLVNAKLIQDGYAFAYTVFPLVKLDEFRALEVEARAASRGLWGGCNVDTSKDIKQTTSQK